MLVGTAVIAHMPDGRYFTWLLILLWPNVTVNGVRILAANWLAVSVSACCTVQSDHVLPQMLPQVAHTSAVMHEIDVAEKDDRIEFQNVNVEMLQFCTCAMKNWEIISPVHPMDDKLQQRG